MCSTRSAFMLSEKKRTTVLLLQKKWSTPCASTRGTTILPMKGKSECVFPRAAQLCFLKGKSTVVLPDKKAQSCFQVSFLSFCFFLFFVFVFHFPFFCFFRYFREKNHQNQLTWDLISKISTQEIQRWKQFMIWTHCSRDKTFWRNESIKRKNSRCTACQHERKWSDLYKVSLNEWFRISQMMVTNVVGHTGRQSQ